MNKTQREALLDRIKRPVARLQNNRTDWFRLQAKAGETPKIYIYDEIGYWGDNAKQFADALNSIEGSEIEVRLNSPGGDIFDGLAIYQSLKAHPANITVVVDGLAASIASVIAMAADKLVMAPKSTMMIHDGWTMSVGNASDMRKTADLLDKQSDLIASVYAERSGQPADFWRDRMREETWYNADEALAAGLIDEVEGKEKPAADEAFDLTVYSNSSRESAPAPVLAPVALKGEHGPEVVSLENEGTMVVPSPETKEPDPFTWDFAAFKSALKEGFRA